MNIERQEILKIEKVCKKVFRVDKVFYWKLLRALNTFRYS